MQLKKEKQRLALIVIKQSNTIVKLQDEIAQHENEKATRENLPKWKTSLNTRDVEALEKISLEMKADTQYIRRLIEILYKHNLEVLNERSGKGRSEFVSPTQNITAKLPITPKKMEILREAFEDRMKSVEDDSRKTDSYFNTIVSNCICQIRKKVRNMLAKKSESTK